MATENPFVKLFSIDFKDHVEVKKSGNTELKYVSWAYAWAEVKKLYPSASYEVKKFNGLPYVYRSEEHTSELQSHQDLVCRLLIEKKKKKKIKKKKKKKKTK